jgi:predicted ATPase
MLSRVLWHLGFPDQALRRSREALALAQKLGRPYPLGSVYTNACILHECCRDVAAVEEIANALSVLADERGFRLWSAMGTLWRGWCLIQRGRVEEGISEVQQARAANRAIGSSGGFEVQGDALMIEGSRRLGRLQEALALLQESEGHSPDYWLPELSLLKGELLLETRRGSGREAEDHFRRAIWIARGQESKSFELRATMSLARLLDKQSKRNEARTILAEIYNWFTEGFDTSDLKDAKVLLEELSA